MLCINCGTNVEKGFTTDVTDLETCLIIVRNVPCYKCKECNEVMYTLDVAKHLEKIVSTAKKCFKRCLLLTTRELRGSRKTVHSIIKIV